MQDNKARLQETQSRNHDTIKGTQLLSSNWPQSNEDLQIAWQRIFFFLILRSSASNERTLMDNSMKSRKWYTNKMRHSTKRYYLSPFKLFSLVCRCLFFWGRWVLGPPSPSSCWHPVSNSFYEAILPGNQKQAKIPHNIKTTDQYLLRK